MSNRDNVFLFKTMLIPLLLGTFFIVNPVLPQTGEINNNIIHSSPPQNYRKTKQNGYKVGFGLSFGEYTTHNSKLKPVYGDVPMFHFNIYGDNYNTITVIQLSYGTKNSINNKIYIEDAGSTTDGMPDFKHYKNLVPSCFNMDFDFLYKIIDHRRFRFVAGPGINLAVLHVKGDEMKGLAGGLLYGDELSEEDTGGGLGLELVAGFYVFIKRYFLQFHAKYQTVGLWYSEYIELPSYKKVTEMGTFDISGVQIMIGMGIQY